MALLDAADSNLGGSQVTEVSSGAPGRQRCLASFLGSVVPRQPREGAQTLVAALRLWGPSCLLVQVGAMLAVRGEEGWCQSCGVTGHV